MIEKYRVAIIGLGRIGARLDTEDSLRLKPCTHLGAWLAHKDRCEIVGICDVQQSAIDWVDEESDTVISNEGWAHEVATLTDYEDLMNKTKPDVVSIATPEETHIKIARVVMRYDPVKLVFLEKPIAKTLSEADLIIDTAREFKVKLAINHTRRWDPVWQHIGKLCREEQPLDMVCYSSGSKIRDAVHMADLINWFNPKHFVFINPQREAGEVDYLLFEVDLLFKSRRIRVTDNGYNSTMYVSADSSHFADFKELEQSCHINRNLYPYSPMYYATEQLLDVLDVVYGNKTGITDPFCTGEQGKGALELALKW